MMMMEGTKGTHIVDIPPVAKDESVTTMTMSAVIEQHPMMEISRSPGHHLLLKLWQREEYLYASRIFLKEKRMDSIRAEIYHICCFFLLYQGFYSTILFMSSVAEDDKDGRGMRCAKWWVPSTLSLVTSVAMAGLVQGKMCRYWKVGGSLQRAKGESRAVTRSIQELRMKGACFELDKESQPQVKKKSKRMKSSSVEVKWLSPLSWCTRYVVTMCLLLFAGLVFPAPKLLLCIL